MFDVNGSPNFGERTLAGTISPDPLTVHVTSGGGLDISTASIPGECHGWATAHPDMNLRLASPMAFLRIFMNAEGSGDTTLLINKPDGSWVCADDTYQMDPGVDLTAAPAGLYNIWVGSYNESTQTTGNLTVTASNTRTPDGEATPLNGAAPPGAGAQNLGAGFAPATIHVAAGGPVNATQSSAGASCRGYMSSAPSFNFTLAQAGTDVRVAVSETANNADTTMVLQRPDGSYECNDDADENRPGIDLANASSGVYHVWIGSYHEGETIASTVTVARTDAPASPRAQHAGSK